MPAPSQAPSTAAPTSSTSVFVSTATMAMKMSASAMVGGVWPTLSVPGISRSGTMRRSLKNDVVGANEPMPSVSKKFVTKPTAICAHVGHATVADRSPGRGLRRASTIAVIHTAA